MGQGEIPAARYKFGRPVNPELSINVHINEFLKPLIQSHNSICLQTALLRVRSSKTRSRNCWPLKSIPKVYSGRGADIVMESLHSHLK